MLENEATRYISMLCPEYETAFMLQTSQLKTVSELRAAVEKVPSLLNECDGNSFSWWRGLEKDWIKSELEIIYSVVYSLLDLYPNTDIGQLLVFAGFSPHEGTKCFRTSNQGHLILYDFYDRMFVDLLRASCEEGLCPSYDYESNGMLRPSDDMEEGILSLISMRSFFLHTTSKTIPKQMMDNLDTITFYATFNIKKEEMRRRNQGSAILKHPKTSLYSDLIISYHEISHIISHVDQSNEDDEKIEDYIRAQLKDFLHMMPSDFSVVSELSDFISQSHNRIIDSLSAYLESKSDEDALHFMSAIFSDLSSDVRSLSGSLYGICVVEMSKKLGALHTTSNFTRNDILLINAKTLHRFVSGILTIIYDLFGKEKSEDIMKENFNFFLNQSVYLLECSEIIVKIFEFGNKNQIYRNYPRFGRDEFDDDEYDDEYDAPKPSVGSVSINELGVWLSKFTRTLWSGYSKPMKNVESKRARRFFDEITGANTMNEPLKYIYYSEEMENDE